MAVSMAEKQERRDVKHHQYNKVKCYQNQHNNTIYY